MALQASVAVAEALRLRVYRTLLLGRNQMLDTRSRKKLRRKQPAVQTGRDAGVCVCVCV